MPELQAILDDYQSQGVEVIAINIGQSLSTIRSYIQGYDYIVLMDMDRSTWGLYRQNGYIPLNYVIASGDSQKVVGWMEGHSDLQIRSWIEEALISQPSLSLDHLTIIDSLGDGDGRADPGETVQMFVTLFNQQGYKDADTVSLTLTTDDSNIVLLDSLATILHVPAGSVGSNQDNPFAFEVLADSLRFTNFRIAIVAQPNDYSATDSFRLSIGKSSLLLVDDDQREDYEKYYFAALDGLGLFYNCSRWLPLDPYLELHRYDTVIWFTGDDSTATLTQEDMDSLGSFLDNGGKLFITGQNIGQDIGSTPFYSNYLHSQFVSDHSSQPYVYGVDGDPIGDDLPYFCLERGDGARNQTSRDIISPGPDADSCFYYWLIKGACGVRFEDLYKVVYLSFGFEGISAFEDRQEVMGRILTWLSVPGTGTHEGTEILTHESLRMGVSPNPFSSRMEISYSIPMRSRVTLHVFDSAGRCVRTLVDRWDDPGSCTIRWDGRDFGGREVPSGLYFLQLQNSQGSVTRKIVCIR